VDCYVGFFKFMSLENLDRFLKAATNYDASDLHRIVGCRPRSG
jgi:hypothetical protein